jgi:hypothetical protein
MAYPRSLAVTLLAISAVLAAGVAGAESKSKGKKPHQVVPTGAEDSPQAPAEDAAVEARFEQMISRSSEGLVEVAHDDGSVSMDLQGRFMSVMVAAPTADGGRTASCHTGREALTQAKAHRTAKSAASKKAPPTATPAPLAPTTTAARELQ